MKKILILALSSSFSLLGFLFPLSPANADLVCVAGECEFIFNKTESLETWPVPPGVNELDFEVYGAQGGAGGGLGGFVSGTLTDLPEVLTVAVGGVGLRGDYSPGGFNGGGDSGGRHANPGSGGGASDIRIGTQLADRIVVAGGGGGYGGPTGGDGGDGGGLSASDGSAGQGGAGAGGSQISGGAGGKSNSGDVDGEQGTFGFGGAGGEDPIAAGGAGGGGGYFGGGGGGADIDPCCLDAGGGGGGSSFADPLHTKDVSFQPGTNVGSGKIVFRYKLPAEIEKFTYQPLTRSSLEVVLEFDQQVVGVELSDFVINGCQSVELEGAMKNYTLALGECMQSGSVTMSANSVGASSNAPTSATTLEFELDQNSPFISFDYPRVTSSDSFEITVETDDSGIFDTNWISSADCLFQSIINDNLLSMEVSDCSDGESQFQFDVDFLTDSMGNKSLEQAKNISVLVDTVAPFVESHESQLAEVSIDGLLQSESNTRILFSEPTVLEPSFIFSGPQQCSTAVEVDGLEANLQTIGCSEGVVSWSVTEFTLKDAAGNFGPAEKYQIEIEIPEVLQPVVEQLPDAPTPRLDLPPVLQVPLPDIESESDIDEKPLDIDGTGIESDTVTPEQNKPLVQIESPERQADKDSGALDPEPNMPKTDGDDLGGRDNQRSDLSIPVSMAEKAGSEDESVNPWAIFFASSLILLLIIGVVLLTKNNRSRAIE